MALQEPLGDYDVPAEGEVASPEAPPLRVLPLPGVEPGPGPPGSQRCGPSSGGGSGSTGVLTGVRSVQGAGPLGVRPSFMALCCPQMRDLPPGAA